MTERELAGIIATIEGTAISLQAAVTGGQKVNTPGGVAVLLTETGLEAVVTALREVNALLLEAIPDDPVYVERKNEEKQEEPQPSEEASTPAEA